MRRVYKVVKELHHFRSFYEQMLRFKQKRGTTLSERAAKVLSKKGWRKPFVGDSIPYDPNWKEPKPGDVP